VPKATRIAPDVPGRVKLALVAALFFAPVVLAVVLYQSGWRPATRVNYGELVSPARAVEDAPLRTLDGQPARFSQLKKKWTMLYFGAATCDRACMEQLYKMRQVHATQGVEADRIQRVFIVTDPAGIDTLPAQLKGYSDMQVFTGSADAIGRLAEQFRLGAASPLDGGHRIYLLDPLGNFFLSYPPDADPTGMRKDLARVLKVSHIG
jgi:cytochrome oxidase Cu insertion factor (SCO1/SenC/PrrC family)